jgi:hypothetical protein
MKSTGTTIFLLALIVLAITWKSDRVQKILGVFRS